MPQSSFLDRIIDASARHGERPALVTEGRSFSYEELFAVARGIRDRLVEQGYADADRIGIVTSVSMETYASLLSVWSLGAAYVPLNSHNPVERNAGIIERANLDVILTSRDPDEWPSHLPATPGTPRILSTLGIEPAGGQLDFPDAAPSDVAYIFFTSGSTGVPKGVPISHANLSAFMDAVLAGTDYGLSADDRVLQMFERTFDLSIFSILAPWSVGGCCCVVPEKGITYMNMLAVLGDQQVTVALMVPSVLAYMRRFFEDIRFPELRLSLFCGEALMQDMVSQWSRCVPNARIENVYGPTEATIFCTRYGWDPDRADAEAVNGIVPIGKAMPGTTALVVDGQGHICPPGARGELCLAGDQVMSGYWNDEAKTAESFITIADNSNAVNAYRTGDIAYTNPDGVLVYCGREDSQVKIDGHRVELGEIEHLARQFIGSSAAAVIVTKQAAGQDVLKLFVGQDIDRADLEKSLRARLPRYMWPSATIVLPELPLNLNGKIDRPALARLASEQAMGSP